MQHGTQPVSQRRGLGFAVITAATFATSGTFATSLLDARWSPDAAVTARLLIAALTLTAPGVWLMRGRWEIMRGAWRTMMVYAVVAVAGPQLCYFYAVQHLSVGIALLLEYLGIILIVAWLWVRHGQRPRRLTVAGIVAVMIGLALVLNLSGHHHVSVVGVMWGLGAAVGLAAFFVLAGDSDPRMPPLAMAWIGMAIGGVVLLLLGFTHLLPLSTSAGSVELLHHRASWVVPVLGLALIAAAVPYATGIPAARILGPKLASFVGLSEVLFAALFAWLGLGQRLQGLQFLGGIVVLIGIAIVKADERDPTFDVEPSVVSPSVPEPAVSVLAGPR